MPPPPARDRFLDLLRTAVRDGTLTKLTLGKYRGTDPALKNIFIRPVTLKDGPHLALVWRYATRDVTKNLPPAAAVAQLEQLIGADFLDAHLFTSIQHAQFESQPDGTARLKLTPAPALATGSVGPALTIIQAATSSSPVVGSAAAHDRSKTRAIRPDAAWLRDLGVTNDRAQPREGMADKYRQIQKFAELLSHLLVEADLPADRPLRVIDMGSGKGYLTFALAEVLGERAHVLGIEARPELVALCNRVAVTHRLAPRLTFHAGTIADAPVGECDVLIALHACDTATDDALARGLAAGARLLVVAPCCQKELRPQLTAPPVLATALRHGIFQERQAEFVTDALRAHLLEWAGYRTKVFEFISTEHTAKNLMIAAIKASAGPARTDAVEAQRLRAFAAFYGIRRQRLAEHVGFPLSSGT